MTTGRDPLLQEREQTHGDFCCNAEISQTLKDIFRDYYTSLNTVHREALDQIAMKLSRILSGHSEFEDHWADIAGYAKLAQEACRKQPNMGSVASCPRSNTTPWLPSLEEIRQRLTSDDQMPIATK